jgi:hypothetical protein
VYGRPADDLQDVGSGRLLLQRLCQPALACLFRLKQPGVLDGNDSLVGEGLEQRNLPVTEQSDFHAPNENHANSLASRDKRDVQDVADAMSGTVATLWVLIGFSLQSAM